MQLARESWQVWGRAVSSKQLPFLEKKADALLWTSVDPLQPTEVIIYGWNTVADTITGAEGGAIINDASGNPIAILINEDTAIATFGLDCCLSQG